MATTNVTIAITTPDGVTINEAVRLFTDSLGYQPTLLLGQTPNPESRGNFAKRKIAEYVSNNIKNRQKQEAMRAVVIPDITVD